MLGDSVQFIYFSGTGNTLLVVREMIDVFTDTGITVRSHRMETVSPEDINPTVTLGLAFPVAFQSTFPFVWKFINALPDVHGTAVFMVDTMMIFSGAIVGPLRKVLTRKGYQCIGAREIIMSNNFLRKKEPTDQDNEKKHRGIMQARDYAKSLITGSARWKRIPVLSDTLHHICTNSFIHKLFCDSIRKKITVNKDTCTGCGLCAELCPVDNISVTMNPEWGKACELCMRCFSFCPVKAISISGKSCLPYRAVSQKEIRTKCIV